VNGLALNQAGALGKGGWSYEGNTLTAVIPVAATSTATRVTIEVQRAAGLEARRSELDGFAGAMVLLRDAYDALQNTSPIAAPPDELIDAMQTGDRLGYHPERVQQEIAHFRELLPKARTAVDAINTTFGERADDAIKRYSPQAWLPGGIGDLQAEKQHRMDRMARAVTLVHEAGK